MVTKHKESFSAAKIQDFLDCERRYELKYLLKQSWPSIPSEPIVEIEENIQKGNAFHFLIFQFFSGIPKDKLISSIENTEIQTWFGSFLEFSKNIIHKNTYPEFHIISQLNDLRLTAVFDLIYLTANNKLIIFDWKTSRFIPKKTTLSLKVQTILYPYLIYETYQEFLPQTCLVPEDISMQYWYPAAPKAEYVFKYEKSTHEHHRNFLKNILNEITNKNIGEFALTNNTHTCGFCSYRSLCDRGTSAANYLDMMESVMEENNILIDFDRLPEIPFDE